MYKYLKFLVVFLCVVFTFHIHLVFAQNFFNNKEIFSHQLEQDNGVCLTFDVPKIDKNKPTKIILYALPNGNNTAQTFGKKLNAGDDWHFDIQHIGAQTKFVRNADTKANYIVVYLENNLKSWPSWRRLHKNSDSLIQRIVFNIYEKYQYLNPKLTLSGHSGGGSFIFGYLNSYTKMPEYIERIGFLDATYGYETEKHHQKLSNWLREKNKFLQVIAYNDSVVVFNGKPLVSATGGTWYRSKLMTKDIANLKYEENADRLIWANKNSSISFILLKNPEAKIFHTVLVEKNGFIHLLLNGSKLASKNYQFWKNRAYEDYILKCFF